VQDTLGLEKFDKDIIEEECNEEPNSDFFLCSYNFDCWQCAGWTHLTG